MSPTYLVVGASSGLGAAAAAHLAPHARVFSAARRPCADGIWVEADISIDAGIDACVAALGDAPLDGLLYMGGVWEEGAFTDSYDFHQSPRAETRNVIAVNLTAPILLAQALAPNLARAADPRIVLIGSTSALDQFAPYEVANTASKFGLRGAALALHHAMRPQKVGVTLINPANIATPEVQEDIRLGDFAPQVPIPMADILHTLDYVLACSAATAPQEINLLQRSPGD